MLLHDIREHNYSLIIIIFRLLKHACFDECQSLEAYMVHRKKYREVHASFKSSIVLN